MAAPQITPTPVVDTARAYGSPDVVPHAWSPDRPGDIVGFQPSGDRLGYQGPDQGFAIKIANGSRYGVRRAVPGMFGAVASDIVLVGAVALGLGALLAASEFWFTVVKWVGAVYLAWLGLRLLRSSGGLDLSGLDGEAARAAPRTVFAKSFLVAVTNPKGYLFCSCCCPWASTQY